MAKPLNNALAEMSENDRFSVVSRSMEKHGGNLNAVARELEVNVSTLYRWVNADEKLEGVLKRARIAAISQS
jgi:transcriptional regulator with PAS, ATPase and Fis domain